MSRRRRLRRWWDSVALDPLTGLPRRDRFADTLERTWARSRTDSLGVLCVDVDGLKRVNDREGHRAGDALVIEVAERLSATAGSQALVARTGGDEFAVLLRGQRAADLERTGAAVVAAVAPVGSVSVGVAAAAPGVSWDAAGADDLWHRADMALLRAKRDGGGRVVVAPDTGAVAPPDPMLDPRSLGLVFQPVVSVPEGRLVRVEALLRDAGSQPNPDDAPAALVTDMEAGARLDPVTTWVVDHALAHAGTWDDGTRPVPVSVNLGAAQVVEPAVVRGLRAALRDAQRTGSALAVEVHRGRAALDDLAHARRMLAEHGVAVVLDDVDLAWPLGAVLDLRPDEVTVSRRLVRTAPDDDAARAALAAVVRAADAVGVSVTAKGVETEWMLQVAVDAGCAHVQGHVVAPPAPANRLVWRTPHLTMRDSRVAVLTGPSAVGTVLPCTPEFSYAERAAAENQRSRDPSSPSGPGGSLCPRGHTDAAEES